jgi:serine phosphatase RsbU (regulator of sigma subunit)
MIEETQYSPDNSNEKVVKTESTVINHRILIIDDDVNLVLSLKEKLYNVEDFSFTVETANDPLAALDLIKSLREKEIHLSLIISDLSMPGMDGNVLLEEAMKYYPEAKKILMSGNPTLDAIIHSLNYAHIYRMLTKPVEDMDFQLTIKQAIKAVEVELQLKETNIQLKHINNNLLKIVDEKTSELKQKNSQLTSSIHYAGLIQKSVLSCETDFAKDITNAFTLILPKDIVSGDFFWYHNDMNNLSYCIADSTGHGVPGAFVSLLAFGALRESFEHTKHKSDVNTIICNANNQFKKTLNNNLNHDSAELGYFFFDKKTYQLQFCGFKIDLYVIRKLKLIELKGSKLVFGDEHIESIDTQHIKTMQMQSGDTIFMTSDGFFDQFGGKDNKKFSSRRFKMLISLIGSHSPSNHRDLLLKEFLDWKGNNEQTDDVSVFGLTIP